MDNQTHARIDVHPIPEAEPLYGSGATVDEDLDGVRSHLSRKDALEAYHSQLYRRMTSARCTSAPHIHL